MESQTRVETNRYNPYLYCLFKGPSSLTPQKGIEVTNDTFVLSYRDLCALVSLVPIDEYNEEVLNRRIEDLGWLIPKAKRHDEIIRYVMEFHPVIPVRFGTIYTSDERVIEVLKNGYEKFHSFLDFISDKEEWGVKVYDEKEKAKKELGRSKGQVIVVGDRAQGIIEDSDNLIEQLEQLDKKISSATLGEAYLLRKKRDNLICQQRIGLLDKFSDQIYQKILSWSVEGRRNRLLSKGATGKESDMILNAVFLLDKREVETFKESVYALAQSYERENLSFKISGPWPCYNFCPDFSLQQP